MLIVKLYNESLISKLSDPNYNLRDAVKLKTPEEIVQEILPYQADPEHCTLELALRMLSSHASNEDGDGSMVIIMSYRSEDLVYQDLILNKMDLLDEDFIVVLFVNKITYIPVVEDKNYLYAWGWSNTINNSLRRYDAKPHKYEVLLKDGTRKEVGSIAMSELDESFLKTLIKEEFILRMEDADTIEFFWGDKTKIPRLNEVGTGS